MLNNGQKEEATVHFDVTAGVPSEAKKNEHCAYCKKPKKVLHTDELEINEVIINYVTITNEDVLRKVRMRLKKHFGLHNRKYCGNISCMKKHHAALQVLESNE